MYHPLAGAPSPKGAVAGTDSPPPTAPPFLAIHQTRRVRVTGGATADVVWVQKISAVILVSHIIALFFHTAMYNSWDRLGGLSVVACFVYLVGIISSTAVLSTTSKLSCGICSVLYAGVGALDATIIFSWCAVVNFHLGNQVILWILLATPHIVGCMSCFEGSMEAFKAARNWDNNKKCGSEARPILVAETEVV